MNATHDFCFTTLEDALEATIYFIESPCSFVQYALWVQHCSKAIECGYTKLKWQEVSLFFYRHVNGANSTCVAFHFAYICDSLVCFYETTSSKVDREEVTKFLEPYWTDLDGSRRECNAMNFHHCIHYLQAAK